MWVGSLQGLMAGGKVMEEGRVVRRRCIRAVTKAENVSFERKTNFKPVYVKKVRFKIHEPCNRCVSVTVSSYSIFRTEL